MSSEVFSCPVFEYQQLVDATDDFSHHILIGSSGEVYRGKIGEKVVAVKRFYNLDIHDPTSYDGYGNEYQVALTLSHPNLVSLIGRCEHEGKRYLVYDYFESYTLATWLESRGRLFPLEMRLAVLLDVCDVLIFLHYQLKSPMVHRDISVRHVLVNPTTYESKVIGFRFARDLVNELSHQERNVVDHPICKDPVYRHSGFRSSLANDVFSIGILILQMLTGNVQESQKDLIKKVHKVKKQNYRPLLQRCLRDHCPDDAVVELFELGKRFVFGKRSSVGRPRMKRVTSDLLDIMDSVNNWLKEREEGDHDGDAHKDTGDVEGEISCEAGERQRKGKGIAPSSSFDMVGKVDSMAKKLEGFKNDEGETSREAAERQRKGKGISFSSSGDRKKKKTLVKIVSKVKKLFK